MKELTKFTEQVQNLYNNTNQRKKYITIILVFIIGFIIFSIISFISTKINLNKNNCKRIKNTYTDFPLITSVNKSSIKDDYGLRDFYIKSAYNCCATGKFKNDWVDICALSNCIKQGARFLDFEIYTVDNEPVIGISTKNSFSYKESYNYVKFSDVCETINNEAFNNSYCPNHFDPLILHFRIKSKNKNIYNSMANTIYNTLSNRILGKEYSYQYNGYNIADGNYVPFKNLLGKVIIIVDKSNNDFENTDLDEYINITSNSTYCRLYRYNEIKYIYDSDELKNFNKEKLTIVLPDLGIDNNNNSVLLSNEYGCQFHCSNMQNFDSEMSFNTSFFDDYNSAFVLKPDELRYKPIVVDSQSADYVDVTPNPTPVIEDPPTSEEIMSNLIMKQLETN